ncbi:DUF5672 family protein [Synechococcus elongatus IITB4]|uniref:DUF5672 family protein n=1 Tax=Synechococcus elongatus TaxID=32046 RepID=UPI0030D5C393
MNHYPIVIIPLYKTQLNFYEIISLKQTVSVLRSHPICLLVPQSLEQTITLDLIPSLNLPIVNHLKINCIDDQWLDSVKSYNHLLLQPFFYVHYQNFTHMLIVQLDAYVFRDELIYWCSQPWDYIGAPLYPQGAPYGEKYCQCIGVGGFSIRKIDSFLRAFKANPALFRWQHLKERMRPFNLYGRFHILLQYFRFLLTFDNQLTQKNNQLHNLVGINEDVVFGKYLPIACPWFRVPPYDIARAFSIDRHIVEDLSILGNTPFGTHAWWTIPENLSAWHPYIHELNN